MLKISLLGKTKIEYAGDDLTGKLGTKAVAMIYLLIANKGRYVPKDKLMLYLWPESSQEAARYNLRYNLWNLKKNLPELEGQTLIQADKDSCVLNKDYPMVCDLWIIKELQEDTASLEELIHARSLFCGDIMEGWYLKNCNEFNELILFDRMICENRRTKILAALSKRYEQEENLNKALEILREEATIEPDNETLALHIMEVYAESGNRAAAINYYRSFKASLWNNLKIEPDERLTAYCENLYESKTLFKPSVQTDREDNTAQFPEALCRRDSTTTGNLSHGENSYRAGTLHLEGFSVKRIEYSLLSDLLTQVIKAMDHSWLADIGIAQVADLASVHSGFLDAYNKACSLPDSPALPAYFSASEQPEAVPVRIMQAFCMFVEIISRHRPVGITVKEPDNADEASLAVLEYLKEQKLENIIVDMNFKLIADRTRYLKENPKGVDEMCKVIDDMKNESLREVVLRMLDDGSLTNEKIAQFVGLSLDEVKKMQAERIS